MKSKLKPEEVLFVGDTYQQDILGAKQVGLKTAWLNIRNEPLDMAKNNPPDREIRSLAQLEEIILSTKNKETTQ
jgi:FMN phosphatase YigB (HAD superfamily)